MAADTEILKQIARLLDRGDGVRAQRLLKPIYQRRRDDPQVLYWVARVNEVRDRAELAERVYRQLLKASNVSPTIARKARQGLERLATGERVRRRDRIESAKLAKPDRLGLLILEATPAERRRELAQQLARILNIDPYSARMQLQTHGWRLYRVGDFAELSIYGRDLRQVGIETFWADRAEIDEIEVFRVNYLEQIEPNFVAVCVDRDGRAGQLTFEPGEVARQVRGGVPLFVNAVSYDISKPDKEKIKRKPEIRDYIQLLDLHLPDRGCILRFCDRRYRFGSGAIFTAEQLEQEEKGLASSAATTRINWNGMLDTIDRQCPNLELWRDFTPFAETTLDYHLMMEGIDAYIDVDREARCNWDPAFQLYSALVWLREASGG